MRRKEQAGCTCRLPTLNFNPEETRMERVIVESLYRIVHRDKERHLYEQRQASRMGDALCSLYRRPISCRIMAGSFLYFFWIFWISGCIAASLHGTDLFHREGKQQRLNEYRQNDDSDERNWEIREPEVNS